MDKKFIEPGKTIGIIGGGQLGRMMALSAKEAGYRIAVLDPAQDSPAGQVADVQITAPYDDWNSLRELAGRSDVITYEFENIDYETLEKISAEAYVPQGAELIRVTQNRIFEKAAIKEAGAAVVPYKEVRTQSGLKDAAEELGIPCVLKTATGGYDGKGQVVIRSEKDLMDAAPLLESGPCILEKWQSFDKEISVIITRGTDGETAVFPIAENVHVNNILHTTVAPARISRKIKEDAISLAEKIVSALNVVGTLAVELFLTDKGQLYVNELAPRPHNSGHYTIEACNISQFGQHIRAVCGWPLQPVEWTKPAAMVNILGQHVNGVIKGIPQHPEWTVHLYGKTEAKQNRKMGHLTILDEDSDQALKRAEESGIWNRN